MEVVLPVEPEADLRPPNTDQVQTLTTKVRQNPHRHPPRPTNIQAVPKDHHQVCHK